MSSLKEKTQIFAIGLLIGLLVAGVFFIFKLDDYFKELNFYKHFAETFSAEKKVDAAELKKSDEKVNNKEKESVKKNRKEKVELVQTESNEVALSKVVISDSIHNKPEEQEEIVVKKDEMISSKTISIIMFNPIVKMSAKDSLLQKVSGISEDKNNLPFINIEFWKSPLNYKGYKLSKYKLIVYGINSADAVTIYNWMMCCI